MRPFSAQGRQATALRTQFKGPPSHPSKAAPIGGIRKRNRRHQNETQGTGDHPGCRANLGQVPLSQFCLPPM